MGAASAPDHPGPRRSKRSTSRATPVAFQGHVSRFANMARDVTPEPAYE